MKYNTKNIIINSSFLDGAGFNSFCLPKSAEGIVYSLILLATLFGNYAIIDHGDGYTTVYGHCSSLSVTAGQSVSQGQQIANVGESGNAHGAHLHFEVRYNGVKQNPTSYVSKP